jgi:hypothetical protein
MNARIGNGNTFPALPLMKVTLKSFVLDITSLSKNINNSPEQNIY